MRTTLDLDDGLLDALMSRMPGSSKTEAIEAAIDDYVGRAAIRQLREMAGTLEIEDVSGELRRVDRAT